MAGALVPLVVIPAAGAVAIAASGSTPEKIAPTNQAPNGGVLVSAGGASSGSTIGQQLATGGKLPVGSLNKLRMINSSSVSSGVVGISPTAGWGSLVSPTNGLDAELQKKLNEIEKYTEAAFNKLDSDARDVARGELNRELKLDPPLPKDASWKDISGAVGAAVGGVAGAYIGGPLGAKVGALVGAYLGVKLEELISKNVDEIKDWFKSRWNDIEDFVKDVGSEIEEAAQDVIDYIGSVF